MDTILLTVLLVVLLFQFGTSMDTIRWNQHVKDGAVLLSKEKNFELGFFSRGKSKYRYVGIWYGQISEKTVEWVANRNNPINDTSGVLTINRYGKLVLYAYNMENTPIWSTNVSVQTTSTCTAQLLDTGNLVLFQDNNSESFMWQSFDYPTDTLLPGMKVGLNWKTGLEWVLTSWKSQDDPATGDYTFRLYSNQSAMPQYFLYKGLIPYWRTDRGPWRTFLSNPDERYYSILTDNPTQNVRMRLNDSGLLEHLTWIDVNLQWKSLWTAPKYQCDQYGHCGANSKCTADNINIFECECLPGYEPKSFNDWNQRNGSGGCASKRFGVSKCGNGDEFMMVERVTDPDTSKAARLETRLSAKECKQECKHLSCTAFMSIQSQVLM